MKKISIFLLLMVMLSFSAFAKEITPKNAENYIISDSYDAPYSTRRVTGNGW